MPVSADMPPDHVLAAFGLTGVRPVPLGSSWEGGWRCGEVVLSMVAENARAAWSAKVRETLFVDGVRLAQAGPLHRRPLRRRGLAGRHVRHGNARTASRRGRLRRGAPARGHGEAGTAAVPDPAARCAVVRRRRLHRRRPRGVGGPAAAHAAAGCAWSRRVAPTVSGRWS